MLYRTNEENLIIQSVSFIHYSFLFSRSLKMANTRLFLLSVLIAFLFAIVIAEPLPEGEPEGEPETGAEPEAGANAEPEKNSVSLAQAHILTAFASFIAFVLLK